MCEKFDIVGYLKCKDKFNMTLNNTIFVVSFGGCGWRGKLRIGN